MKRSIWFVAVVPLLALLAGPASAKCHVVGFKNGEALCEQSSDGAKNHPFTNSTTNIKTMGDIVVTTSRNGARSPAKTGSRVLMRSANSIRRQHNWH